MKAVVIGGSGQLGGWLLMHLSERGHEAVGTYATRSLPGLAHVDAADLAGAAAWLKNQRPDVVFYPAGFTWVDGCERDPSRCRASNLDQPLNLARAAAEAGARFVHFSTDYLFDGRDGPYGEDAPTGPLNEYGRAKLDAERALTDAPADQVLIARTCWVYGPERQGKNFAYQSIRTLRAGKPLVCPSDQWACPSYGPDVALAVVELVEQGISGLVHVAGPEWVDRPNFARALARGFGLDPSLVVARPTADLGQGAPRPLKGGLRTARLDPLLPGRMRPVESALADFRACLASGDDWADPFAPG